MPTYIVQRRFRDSNTGEMSETAICKIDGADSSAADTLAGRLTRAARQLHQFKQHSPFAQMADRAAWITAATTTLGALDPGAVVDPNNPIADGNYFVTEVAAFVEPTEDPPATDRERITREERDLTESP